MRPIDLKVPKIKEFPKLDLHLPGLSRSASHLSLAIWVLMAAFAGVGTWRLLPKKSKPAPAPAVASVQAEGPKAEFTPYLPDGSIDRTESRKYSYDANRKITSFTDKIAGVDVTVTQQPLPETFKPNPQHSLEELAHEFYANQALAINSGKAFLGTSIRGPQSVVYMRENFLLFVSSTAKVDDKEWVVYLNSLK